MSDCPVVSKELREQLTEPFFEREKGILIVISNNPSIGDNRKQFLFNVFNDCLRAEVKLASSIHMEAT